MKVSVKQASFLLLLIMKYSKSDSIGNLNNSNLSQNKVMKRQSEYDLITQLQKFSTLNKSHMIKNEKHARIIRGYENKYGNSQIQLSGYAKIKEQNKHYSVELNNVENHNEYTSPLMRSKKFPMYSLKRLKRNVYGTDYKISQDSSYGLENSDSGAFISSLTEQITRSVIGLSSRVFKGSSPLTSQRQSSVLYGPPIQKTFHHDFSLWDFKRAILSTLIQAIKAIGGSILALKGQLIKGSGFFVSSKGRVISSTGNLFTGLGTQLASSAIVQPPLSLDQIYGQVSHNYQSSHALTAIDNTYSGPLPSSDPYHSTFGSSSDLVYSYAYHQ